MLFYKQHECTVQKKIAPTESDLELIQAYAPEPIDAEKLFVGRMSLANDDYDRSHERFPVEYLQRFAETIPGKAVMIGHDYRRDPEGTFFGGEVQERAGRKELITRYYLLESSPLAAKVKAGIARSVSIGFEPDLRLCDLDGKDYDGWWKGEEDCCEHIAGREYDGQPCRLTYGGDTAKVSGVEGSFVWMGCQYGAEAIGGNAALAPRAKAAHFAGQPLWQVPDLSYFARADHRSDQTDRSDRSAKEHSMPPDPKETASSAPPAEPKLTPEQERYVALGKAYETFAQTHVKSRYGACGMEAIGERLAAGIPRASAEEIEAEMKAADATFNARFPGTGKGAPLSDGQQAPPPPRKFNPLRRM